MNVTRHSDICYIKNVKNSKIVEAAVMDFVDKKYLTVAVNKSVKLNMVWNGSCYEGRSAGMDFESDGPTITKTNTGLRG